jgi:hypothetical protein
MPVTILSLLTTTAGVVAVVVVEIAVEAVSPEQAARENIINIPVITNRAGFIKFIILLQWFVEKSVPT